MSLVHGLTSAKQGVPLLVDSTGRAVVVASIPLPFSPMARSARYENLALAAGLNASLVIFTVTAGEVWEINVVGLRYTGTVGTVFMNMYVDKAGVLANIYSVNTLVSDRYQFAYMNLIMDAGDIMRLNVSNATLNDDVTAVMNGRRIG